MDWAYLKRFGIEDKHLELLLFNNDVQKIRELINTTEDIRLKTTLDNILRSDFYRDIGHYRQQDDPANDRIIRDQILYHLKRRARLFCVILGIRYNFIDNNISEMTREISKAMKEQEEWGWWQNPTVDKPSLDHESYIDENNL